MKTLRTVSVQWRHYTDHSFLQKYHTWWKLLLGADTGRLTHTVETGLSCGRRWQGSVHGAPRNHWHCPWWYDARCRGLAFPSLSLNTSPPQQCQKSPHLACHWTLLLSSQSSMNTIHHNTSLDTRHTRLGCVTDTFCGVCVCSSSASDSARPVLTYWLIEYTSTCRSHISSTAISWWT